MTHRRIEKDDISAALSLIRRNYFEVNSKDYGLHVMEKYAAGHDESWLLGIAQNSHMYVFFEDELLVGVGTATKDKDDCIIETVFVLPECQGKGIGRQIMSVLEADEYCRCANRIYLHSSLSANIFYEKLGYKYADGKKIIYDDDYYLMEKFK